MHFQLASTSFNMCHSPSSKQESAVASVLQSHEEDRAADVLCLPQQKQQQQATTRHDAVWTSATIVLACSMSLRVVSLEENVDASHMCIKPDVQKHLSSIDKNIPKLQMLSSMQRAVPDNLVGSVRTVSAQLVACIVGCAHSWARWKQNSQGFCSSCAHTVKQKCCM